MNLRTALLGWVSVMNVGQSDWLKKKLIVLFPGVLGIISVIVLLIVFAVHGAVDPSIQRRYNYRSLRIEIRNIIIFHVCVAF